MHGDPEGFDVRPEAAFVLEDGLHARRLSDEREGVVRAVVLGKMPRAMLRRFLGHEAREVDFHRQVRDVRAQFPQGPKHRGHRAFGVARAASPNAAVTHFAAEGINRHAHHADGVRVRSEHDARLRFAVGRRMGSKAPDDIRSPRQDLLQHDLRATGLEELTDEHRAIRLACVLCACLAIGIHRRDADEGLAEFGDGLRKFHAGST